jgi:hypothetical protein
LDDVVRSLMADRYRILLQAWDDRVCRLRNLKLNLVTRANESIKTIVAMRVFGLWT